MSFEEDVSDPTDSTHKAVKKIMTESNSSVGIFPDSTVDQ